MSATDVYNVAIIGAGVVGSALAASLKIPKICIIEKEWGRVDTIIGELLQPGGIISLQKLGLDACLDGIDAAPLTGYCMLSEFGKAIVIFPKICSLRVAKGFKHDLFVSNLREKALSNPNVTRIDGVVTNLIYSPDDSRVVGVKYTGSDGTPGNKVLAKLVVVANGCFSRLRPRFLTEWISLSSWYSGFMVKDCKLPHEGVGNIAYGAKGNILMYRISSTAFRVLVCIDSHTPPSDSRAKTIEIIESCSEIIPSEIYKKILAAANEDKIKIMPNYQLPSRKPSGRGVVYAGDSLTIRHPIAGGGMTVGLNDALILSGLLDHKVFSDPDTAALDAAVNTYYKIRMPVANVMNIFSHGLFNLSRSLSQGQRLLRANFLKYEIQNTNRDHHLYFMSGYV